MPIDISIVLERADAIWQRGEEIAGHVRVRSDAKTKVTVPLQLEWHTHGKKAERAIENVSMEELFDGELAAGEERNLPFTVTVPATGDAYAGQLFQVELRLRALAEVGDEFRPAAAITPITLTPSPPARAFRVEPVSHTTSEHGMGCLLQSLGIFVLGALGVLAALAFPEMGFLAPFGAIVALIGIALALVMVKRALAERKVGAVGLTVEQGDTAALREAPGTTPLHATLTTRATGATAKVRLRVQETTGQRHGDDRVTYHEPLYDETIELVAEAPGTFRGEIPLPSPAEVPLPLRQGRNLIEWELFVTVDASGAPEWLQRYALAVSTV